MLSTYACRMDDVFERLSTLPGVAEPADARSAVLVPLYPDPAGTVRVILTKRPDDMRTHPGDVVFPGGRIEPGEDVVETATREAWEETGIDPASVDVIGGLTPITTRNRANLIVPVVARVARPAAYVIDPREVDVVIEPPLTDLLDESRWRTQDFMGHQLWFFEFAEGVLWGATGFMMRELLSFLRPPTGTTTPTAGR
jgi:8-oxo-dGTP pyrophosphatase MutT (NUDIX family)